MTVRATAWFLYPGDQVNADQVATLVREEFELPPLAEDEVLAEPLYGSWEGNMGHAVQRKPVDVCRQRSEPKVILGNSGVVRILDVGRKVTTVAPGQRAIIYVGDIVDAFGYAEKMLGYDSPATMGCLATRMKAKQHNFVPIPESTRHPLARWGAFSVRYVTAFANWHLAMGTFRLLVEKDALPAPNVWGWGGGTTLAELDLARRAGCKTVMVSGSDRNLALIERTGITPLDRRKFGNLSFDERRFSTDPSYRRTYLQAENAFLSEVKRLTDGAKVQIFVDYIGTAVFRATTRALSREAVVCTAGWKEGMVIQFLRAVECIDHHQHVHTHYARYDQAVSAVDFAERSDWVPLIDERIFTFDEIPELSARYAAGELGMFPIFSVNPQ